MSYYPDFAYTIRQKGTTWNTPQAPIQEADNETIRTAGKTPIEKNSISVLYPNPNNGNFVIQSTGDLIQEISISDNHGKEVARIMDIHQNEYACTMNLAEGVYWVTVKTNKKVEVVRVIVIK